ncbi:hypothetical protein CFP65_1991 [Kitasatospora sp. MMS16-BH015]|nr:hypothetical protein CFP65_1991 [Kitasatospora sp. MMS16-BH015]
MGRNRKQLTSSVDRPRRLALARELCACHDASDLPPTLAELAAASGLHVATVRRVLNAEAVPAWDAVAQIADATRADARTRHRLENLWLDARLESRPAWYRPGRLATREPATIGDYAQLRESLLLMLRDAGSPSLRELEAKAGFNLLPHSTLERTLAGKRKPTPDEVAEFVKVCDTYGGDQKDWVAAVERCSAGTRTEDITRARTVGAGIDAVAQLERRRTTLYSIPRRFRPVPTAETEGRRHRAQAQREFTVKLRGLWAACGNPLLQTVHIAMSPEHRPSLTGISDIMSGRRLPSLEALTSLVQVLLSIMDGRTIDQDDSRVDEWRNLWMRTISDTTTLASSVG